MDTIETRIVSLIQECKRLIDKAPDILTKLALQEVLAELQRLAPTRH